MSLGNTELRSFLKDVGAKSFGRYLKTHGATGEDGLDKSLRWAAWNFRGGERAGEATFLMTHQAELRRLIEQGESQWKKRKGKSGPSESAEFDSEEHLALREPELAISFDEDEEDEEDAYSFGSAAGFSFRPPGMTEEPEPLRDGFMDAARDLVERAAFQDSGLTSSLDTIQIDDDTPEDSKDLMTFGTVAVDAPASPGWVPPPTDEPSLHSAMAPVFKLAEQPARSAPQEKPVFLSQEVHTDLPAEPRELTPISAPNAPSEDEEATVLGKPDNALAEAIAQTAQAPASPTVLPATEEKNSKLPLILGSLGALMVVVAVSVGATLGTLSMTSEGTVASTAPVVVPVPAAVAPVAQPELPAVADVDLTDPDLIEPDPDVVEPDPEVVEPDPEVVEPDPEVVEPEIVEPEVVEPEVVEPEVVEPEVVEPEVVEPEVVEPEPAAVIPEPPAAAGPNMVGSWRGTNGSAALVLNLTSQNGGTVSGTMTMTGPNGAETSPISGQVNPNGSISLSQIGGTASFSGNLTETQATGTWRPSPGTAARQWFVVKQN